jgi:hypothetical protein
MNVNSSFSWKQGRNRLVLVRSWSYITILFFGRLHTYIIYKGNSTHHWWRPTENNLVLPFPQYIYLFRKSLGGDFNKQLSWLVWKVGVCWHFILYYSGSVTFWINGHVKHIPGLGLFWHLKVRLQDPYIDFKKIS